MKKEAEAKAAAARLLKKQTEAAIKIQSFARMLIARNKLYALEDAKIAAEHRQLLLERQQKLYGDRFGAGLVSDDEDSEEEDSESDEEDEDETNAESLYITIAASSLFFLLLFPKFTMYLLFSAACLGGGGLFALEYNKQLVNNKNNVNVYYGQAGNRGKRLLRPRSRG